LDKSEAIAIVEEQVEMLRINQLDGEADQLKRALDTLLQTGEDVVKGEVPVTGDLAATWLPIESAPKDGTKFLLLDADGVVVHGFWFERFAFWSNYWADCEVKRPTHWMPIPPTTEVLTTREEVQGEGS
jgi:hypothetical protein